MFWVTWLFTCQHPASISLSGRSWTYNQSCLLLWVSSLCPPLNKSWLAGILPRWKRLSGSEETQTDFCELTIPQNGKVMVNSTLLKVHQPEDQTVVQIWPLLSHHPIDDKVIVSSFLEGTSACSFASALSSCGVFGSHLLSCAFHWVVVSDTKHYIGTRCVVVLGKKIQMELDGATQDDQIDLLVPELMAAHRYQWTMKMFWEKLKKTEKQLPSALVPKHINAKISGHLFWQLHSCWGGIVVSENDQSQI